MLTHSDWTAIWLSIKVSTYAILLILPPGIIIGWLLASGLILAFARGLGEFGAAIVLAGNTEGETRTIPLAVFTHLQKAGGEGAALWLGGFSVALSMVALLLSEWSSANARKRMVQRS